MYIYVCLYALIINAFEETNDISGDFKDFLNIFLARENLGLHDSSFRCSPRIVFKRVVEPRGESLNFWEDVLFLLVAFWKPLDWAP